MLNLRPAQLKPIEVCAHVQDISIGDNSRYFNTDVDYFDTSVDIPASKWHSEMLTIERLIELKEVVKWHTVFCEAGLNASTMRSAMKYSRPLRAEEGAALVDALARRGVRIDEGVRPLLQGDLFDAAPRIAG